ncbi:glycopeptide antibiotics resistance protein [Pseudarthrobacter sp. W1I19]|uniref:VanZ family protein n=1 Tax=Pseudarthrobacter sp. W1I19 TaxID=3042288 RepID=UPI0027897CAE|nr:VanZ family protein [Pseudarthrobacter sp. W1I19]MDQ0922300.1 glycopeptide antibiotics resistance protein [Pseudarthrobacter sp. W1I19]
MKHLDNQRIWQTVLAAMLIPLALLAFWPAPVDQPVQGLLIDVLELLHKHGIPHWIDYGFVEASANVALFVPLGLSATLALPEKRWWQIGAFGLLISGCIELGQLLFLHNRFASPLDLVTNLLGTFGGTQLAAIAVNTFKARPLPAAGPQSGGQ